MERVPAFQQKNWYERYEWMEIKLKIHRRVARVLHANSNLFMSRRCRDERDKKMFKNVRDTCGACRAIVFVRGPFLGVRLNDRVALGPGKRLQHPFDFVEQRCKSDVETSGGSRP